MLPSNISIGKFNLSTASFFNFKFFNTTFPNWIKIVIKQV